MKNTKTKLISSVTVLLICFAMLIGSTFAWFTDSASTGVNKIQAGTLQIDLKMKGESGDWVNAEGQSLTWQKADGYENQEVLWEPGATYKLPTLKITNNGNLALQFKVLINGVSGDLELLDALEFSYAFNWMEEDNYRVDSGSFEGSAMRTMPYEIPFDRAEVENNIFGEELDLLNGYLLYTADDDPTHIGYYTLQAHMKEDAGNMYQGKALENLSITIVATQVPNEIDSFNGYYDKDAEYALPVSTADEFAAALASGNDIILNSQIQMPEVIEIKNDVTIYGSENGSLLVPDNADRVINITDTTEPVTLTLSNVDVVGPTTGTYTRGVSVYGNSDVKVVVDNSSISANYYALNIASANDNVEAVIQNTTLTGWCAFQTWSAGTKATFRNCKLIGNNDKDYNAEGWNDFATLVINENTTNTELVFENCDIEANKTTGNKQYLLSVRASDAKVTLNNCRFYADGSEIADDDLGNYLNIYPEASDLTLTIDGTVVPIQ